MSRIALYVGVAVVAGVGLYVWRKRKPGESLGEAAGRTAAAFAFDTAAGAAAGVVKGIGEAVGIPDTDPDQCEADLARGDLWAASFSCPASRFIDAAYGSTRINHAAIEDARQIDRIMERQQARADAAPVVQPHGADYATPGLPAYFGA